MSLLFPGSSQLPSERRLPEDSRQLPVIGWRSWRLRRSADGVVLQSLFGSERWEIGVTSARCRRCASRMPTSHDQVPSVSCEWGLYAFSSPTDAIRHLERQLAPVFAGCGQPLPVAGAVVGWGRVVQQGRQGWRSECARPLALLKMGQLLLGEAAVRYNVELASLRGLCLLPLEYGDALTAA